MSKIGISIKLDVSKLDKTRFFKGTKGTYCDLTAFVDLDNKDDYGQSGFITQELSKEEREAKIQMPIVGNTAVFYKDGGQAPQPSGDLPAPQQTSGDFDDDIPF